MLGEIANIPCQMYFRIQSFFINGSDYMAEGILLVHSSMRQMRQRVATKGYILLKNRKEAVKLSNLRLNQSLRHQNIEPMFCYEVYDETTRSLTRMTEEELAGVCSELDDSLREGCVQVVTNIHIDDASQVNSKM